MHVKKNKNYNYKIININIKSMKNFIGLFRQYPSCTGLLCLILISHLFEPKDAQTPLLAMPKEFIPIFFFYVIGMLIYMLFILPQIEAQKREKITWHVVASSIIVLTCFML